MKKSIIAVFAFFFGLSLCFAQANPQQESEDFPEIKEKPFIVFDWGSASTLTTRIEIQDYRSNFVRQDFLTGAYLGIKTVNMMPCNSIIKISAFYPIKHTFNGMNQKYTQMFLYAFDIFAGPDLELDMWHYVRFNFSIGLHYYLQMTDDFFLQYLGAAGLVGIELPVAKTFTIVMNGLFTFDYPNLGTNQMVQPYDYEWQYQLNVGLRFSSKNPNVYSYIKSKK